MCSTRPFGQQILSLIKLSYSDADEAKPKLLVLYHVQNYTSPLRPEVPVEEIKKCGYDGKIILSQDQDIY